MTFLRAFVASSAIAVTLFALACGGGTIQKQKDPDPIPEPKCGDGRVDADLGEQCDGSDLGGNSCTGLGFDLGTVSCDGQCHLVTSQCVKLCGDGNIGPGEECDGTKGPLACADWGYKACTSACKVDGLHCKTASFSAGMPVNFSAGGVSIITDLSPEGVGDLVTTVPEFFRLQTHLWDPTKGFQPGRILSRMNDGVRPALPIAGDVDGDGHMDLAAINLSGTVDRYRFVPAGAGNPTERFQVEPLPVPADMDGGTACNVEQWIGAGAMDSTPGTDFAALGCPESTSTTMYDAVFVFHGGTQATAATRIDAPKTVAAAFADDNGDGLLDLITVDQMGDVSIFAAPEFTRELHGMIPVANGVTGMAAGDLDGDGDADLVIVSGVDVTLFENTGTAFASAAATEPATAVFPLVRDLDLDGLPDLAWADLGGKVQIRRNLGSFVFTKYEVATGGGTPIGLSAGDADGDGDPDLVASVSTSATSTQSVSYLLLNPVK